MRSLALVALTGCSFGVGSPYVGKWRPHRHVDVEACLVDDTGACTDHKQIITETPPKHFWGAILQFPGLGAASVTRAGDTTAEVRAEPSLELLSGFGRFGWGVRAGAIIDGNAIATPVTAIGHFSATDRVGLYAGAGFSPWARLALDHMPVETSHLGARVLVGAQLALTRILILSVEADSLWIGFDGGYHSLGLTGHIGVFL